MTKCFPPISMMSVFCYTLALVCKIIWSDIILDSNHNVGSGGLSSWLRGAWQLLIVRLWNGIQSNHPSKFWNGIQSINPSIFPFWNDIQSINVSIHSLKWYTVHSAPPIHSLCPSLSYAPKNSWSNVCSRFCQKWYINRYVNFFSLIWHLYTMYIKTCWIHFLFQLLFIPGPANKPPYFQQCWV